MITRVTQDYIQELKENEIFVFGSNQSGRHGKGAAKTALRWGAIYGRAEGLQGRTYGIPTVDASVRRTLSIKEIEPYITRFLIFAEKHPELLFLVTEIGCGLAGYKPKDIAPLFIKARSMNNVSLPKRFWHKIES